MKKSRIFKYAVVVMGLLIVNVALAQESPITVAEYDVKITTECDQLDQVPEITATTSCEKGKLKIEKTDMKASGGCAGTIIRQWMITDGCRNELMVEQFITLVDNTLPEISEVEDVEVLQLEDAPKPTVSDNCYQDIKLTHTDEMKNVGGKIVTIRTYQAIDGCGNIAVQRQKITTASPE